MEDEEEEATRPSEEDVVRGRDEEAAVRGGCSERDRREGETKGRDKRVKSPAG